MDNKLSSITITTNLPGCQSIRASKQDAVEKCLITVLESFLNKEVKEEDASKCTFIYALCAVNEFLFVYDGLILGKVIKSYQPFNTYSVQFHPYNQ